MTPITANLKLMFEAHEPWYVSNSEFNLGPSAAWITWTNARECAAQYKKWLRSDVDDACERLRDWARDTGAWSWDEIAKWTKIECLALFVQNVAAELRELGIDDQEMTEVIREAQGDDYPGVGHYYHKGGQPFVDYYTLP